MKKLRLTLCLLATLSLSLWAWAPLPALAENAVGPTNAILCNKANSLIGTGAAASIVPGVAGQSINICGWHVTNTAATGTFQFVYGTGATCTSPTSITPVFSVSNTAPSADHISVAWFSVPAGQTVCLNATVTTVTAEFYFSQF